MALTPFTGSAYLRTDSRSDFNDKFYALAEHHENEISSGDLLQVFTDNVLTTLYNASTTYSQGDKVMCTNGLRYIYTNSSSSSGNDPTDIINGYWRCLTTNRGLFPSSMSGYAIPPIGVGGNYQIASATTITIEAGSCISADGQHLIEWDEQTITVNSGPISPLTANHLFACFDGVIRIGAYDDYGHLETVVGYTGPAKWIGYVSSSNSQMAFVQNGPMYSNCRANRAQIGTINTTPSTISLISIVPLSHTHAISFGGLDATPQRAYLSDYGYNNQGKHYEMICKIEVDTANADSQSANAWGDKDLHRMGLLPFDSGYYFYTATSASTLTLKSLYMNRW